MANTLGSTKLPDTKPYRVRNVGATYLKPTEGIKPNGDPGVIYVQSLAAGGDTVELIDSEARRLTDLEAVKPADAPLEYEEMDLGKLVSLAGDHGLTVRASGADGTVLKDDVINALRTFDAGQSKAESSDDGYKSQSPEELQALATQRGLSVTGTGANGNVLKADLVQALEADDAAKAS